MSEKVQLEKTQQNGFSDMLLILLWVQCFSILVKENILKILLEVSTL